MKIFPLLLTALLLTGCSGLPAAREMGDMALLRTLGVDAAEAGVAVTGSTGPRAKGLQAEGESSLVLAAERDSLSGASLAMQGQSGSFVFFGYVDQLLLGEELAKQGVAPVLDHFARNGELSLGARIWLVKDASAREAIETGGEEGVEQRLESLRADGRMGIAAPTRTAGEVYTDLLELGSAYLPALSPAGAGTAQLTEQGYAILKGDALAGFLEGEAALGLELLAGGPVGHVLKVGETSLKTTSACTRSRLERREGSPLTLKVACTVEARLVEYDARPQGERLDGLRQAAAEQEQERVEAAVARLKALGADCAGLGVRAAMLCPAQWQDFRKNWPERFADIPVEIEVQVKLQA